MVCVTTAVKMFIMYINKLALLLFKSFNVEAHSTKKLFTFSGHVENARLVLYEIGHQSELVFISLQSVTFPTIMVSLNHYQYTTF